MLWDNYDNIAGLLLGETAVVRRCAEDGGPPKMGEGGVTTAQQAYDYVPAETSKGSLSGAQQWPLRQRSVFSRCRTGPPGTTCWGASTA